MKLDMRIIDLKPHNEKIIPQVASLLKERGGLTLWLGTDDEDNQTSLSGVDLYPNVFEHAAKIKNLRGHPLVYDFSKSE